MSTRRVDADHEVVPVLNKIDLPAAEPERVKAQIEDVIGLDAADAMAISAKTGAWHRRRCWRPWSPGCRRPRRAIPRHPLKALLVDSWYDAYLGVITLVRVVDGALTVGQKIRLMATGAVPGRSTGSASLRPKMTMTGAFGGRARSASSPPASRPSPRPRSATPSPRNAARPKPRFRASSPACRWCSAASTRSTAAEYEELRDSLAKLALNDASFHFEAETSAALGLGFRCGFLGLLHLEIIQERLEREFDLDLITTAPSRSSTRST